MAPPTQTQRLEQIEESVADLRRSMIDQVAEVVNRAATDMQQTLVSQITSTLDQVTQKLQIRIDRARESNETLISDIQQKQDAFHSEVRSTVSALKTLATGSVGNSEFVRPPHDMGGRNGSFGDGFDSNPFGRGERQFQRNGDESGNKGGADNPRSNWKYRKLDLPTFDGTNPDGLLLRAERYFKFYQFRVMRKN